MNMNLLRQSSRGRFVNKKTALLLAIIGCLLYLLLQTVPVSAADVLAPGCEGVSDSTLCNSNTTQAPGDNELYGPDGVLTKVARIIATVVGAASVIMIVIGSIRYVLSSGDSQNVNSAKNTILYAIVGLIVALLAQAIVIFVLSRIE